MNHCEMIWSTAGTKRDCGRCLSLKDSVVGYSDESGVQLPPLHPRCRCVIVYRETAKPATSGGTQQLSVYETQIQSHDGSGHVKPDKIIAGHDRPRTAEPLNIIDHLDKNGKIDKRAFYDENGRPYFEINTINHGNPKNHPFGSHGEHAHDVVWDGDKVKWAKGKELTAQERKDNGDIL